MWSKLDHCHNQSPQKQMNRSNRKYLELRKRNDKHHRPTRRPGKATMMAEWYYWKILWWDETAAAEIQ